MAALTIVTKISSVHVITAMTAGAGFAELNTTGYRARVADLTLKIKVRAIEFKVRLSVMIEFPK